MTQIIARVQIVFCRAMLLAFAPTAFSCEVLFMRSGESLVAMADTIVVATPLQYAASSAERHRRSEPILFRVTETLRGIVRTNVALPGDLVADDDFNDRPSPYNFVRPGGRHGNCFADTYRVGASYLFLLKTTEAGGLTVTWSPLSPANEQLHSPPDPWLLWVRKQVHRTHLESANP